MEKNILRNIDRAVPLNLKDLVDYLPGQIVSKTLSQNKAVSLTLFAFDKGEEISAHESDGDAIMTVLDGEGEVAIGEEKFRVKTGETIVMPANIPHAVVGIERFKMYLIVVFSSPGLG